MSFRALRGILKILHFVQNDNSNVGTGVPDGPCGLLQFVDADRRGRRSLRIVEDEFVADKVGRGNQPSLLREGGTRSVTEGSQIKKIPPNCCQQKKEVL